MILVTIGVRLFFQFVFVGSFVQLISTSSQDNRPVQLQTHSKASIEKKTKKRPKQGMLLRRKQLKLGQMKSKTRLIFMPVETFCFVDFARFIYPALPTSCIWLQRHILKTFQNGIIWCKKFPQYFHRAGEREFRYLEYLETKGIIRKFVLNPCDTRWGSYFNRVCYNAEYLEIEKKLLRPNLQNRDSHGLAIFEMSCRYM